MWHGERGYDYEPVRYLLPLKIVEIEDQSIPTQYEKKNIDKYYLLPVNRDYLFSD